MTAAEITNILMGVLITLIGSLGKAIYDKLTKIEKDVQQGSIDSASIKKDIEYLRIGYTDHEARLTKLEG